MAKKQSAAIPGLRFSGDPDLPIRDIPARDLEPADVARIAHRRALTAWDPGTGDPRPDPLAPDPALVEAVIADLLARPQHDFELSTEPAGPAEPEG